MIILESSSFRKIIIAILQLLFFVAIFILIDFILMYFIDGSSDRFKYIIALDLAIGLVFAGLLSYTGGIAKKIIYLLANLIITLYAEIALIEIILKVSFDTFYTIETIIYNAKAVISEYGNDIGNIVMSRELMVLLFILIIFFSFYTSKVLYFNEKIIIKEGSNTQKIIKLVLCIVVVITSTFIGTSAVRGDSYDFNELIMSSGLKSAVYYEYAKHGDISFVLYVDNKNDTEDDYIGERNEIVVDNTSVINITEDVTSAIEENINVTNDTSDTIGEIVSIKNESKTIENVAKNVIASVDDDVNSFVLSRTLTGRNAYTGLFKGKNLIMICAEAFNSVIVDENLFPTLYRLINNGFKFNHFYQQKEGSTSSGEFAFMTGLLPIYNDRSFMKSIHNNMGFTVSSMMHKEGYNTYSFHNGLSTFYNRDKTHGKFMSFDNFVANDTGLSSISGSRYPSDFELFKYTYDLISKDKPFFAHYMTYSGHMPYTNYTTSKRYKIVDAYYGNAKSEPVKTYIAKNLILEEGLTNLINNLEVSGLINDTVICLVPDHYPYGLYNANATTGEKKNYVAELYNDPDIDSHPMLRDRTNLIIWSGCLENEHKDKTIEVNKIASTIDVTPTLLNLFDVPFDSRIYPGQDIFSDEEGIVVYNNGKYIANGDINIDGTINNESIERHQNYARNIINYCKYFINSDYYGKLENSKR